MIQPLSWVFGAGGDVLRFFFSLVFFFNTDFQHSNPIPLAHPIRMAEGGGNGKALAPIQ